MEAIASPPLENLLKREAEDCKERTEVNGGEEHVDCLEIDFTDDDDDDDDDDGDEDYCYVIDHSNHKEHYVISHCEAIAEEGYDNGNEDEYDDSDFDDDDDDDDDDEEDDDDSDDDNCIEIVPIEFSQKLTMQVPNDALVT